MTKKHYDWSDGPAKLEPHSVAKHQVVRAYLQKYFETLTNDPRHDRIRLSIVDGFAGGGEYRLAGTSDIHLGSPFIALDAVRDAEAKINTIDKRKPLLFDIDYHFVEKNRNAFAYLADALARRGHTSTKIHLHKGDFNQHAPAIIAAINRRSPKAGRSLFVLDQYGYTQVPMALLREIFRQLPRAEVILTFNVDALTTYVSENLPAILHTVGLDGALNGMTIENLQRQKPKAMRALLQAALYKEIVDKAGAKFYRPFFIRSEGGFGDFWLLHLSMHPTACDVMTGVHWQVQTSSIHYGGSGLDMFMQGYITSADDRFTNQEAFIFDTDSRLQSGHQLQIDLARHMHQRAAPVGFGALYSEVANTTPATREMLGEALADLAKSGELSLLQKSGGTTVSARQIEDATQISLPAQKKFSFASVLDSSGGKH